MLSTLPNRVSALLSDPFHAVFHETDQDLTWNGNGSRAVLRKVAPMSLWQDENAVYIEMDVPGIALSDLSVVVENGKLMIRGERKSVDRPSEFLHEERFFGQFERTVALNEWADPSSIEATLRDGVLSIKLSKKPEAKRQHVAINYCNGTDAKKIEACE